MSVTPYLGNGTSFNPQIVDELHFFSNLNARNYHLARTLHLFSMISLGHYSRRVQRLYVSLKDTF
jgi:hypothetical protein